jgi:hypothetical protein
MRYAATSPFSSYYNQPGYSLNELLSSSPSLPPYCHMLLSSDVIKERLLKLGMKGSDMAALWELADDDRV